MNKQANIIIRMGAPYFDVNVRGGDGKMVTFNMRQMKAREQGTFIKELVKAFREAGL